MLSAAEQAAIAQAKQKGDYWLVNLLGRQARGRFVHETLETLMRKKLPQLQYGRVGVDFFDPITSRSYEILSNTVSNIERHAKRMPNVAYRMIRY